MQKLNGEMSDLRLMLEDSNSRNNLLEKKQRKYVIFAYEYINGHFFEKLCILFSLMVFFWQIRLGIIAVTRRTPSRETEPRTCH